MTTAPGNDAVECTGDRAGQHNLSRAACRQGLLAATVGPAAIGHPLRYAGDDISVTIC